MNPLRQAPSVTVRNAMNNPVVDARNPRIADPPPSELYSYANAIASSYGLLWANIARAPRAKRLPLLKGAFGNELLFTVGPNRFIQTVKNSGLGKRHINHVAKLLDSAEACRGRLNEQASATGEGRKRFSTRNKIQRRAWRSIDYFKKRCEKKGRIVGFKKFKEKISNLVRLRDREREPFEAGISKRVGSCLEEIAAYQSVAGKGNALPNEWPRLLSRLRGPFYIALPTLAARDYGRADRKLLAHPHKRGLPAELAVFNIACYLRFMAGWKPWLSLETAHEVSSKMFVTTHEKRPYPKLLQSSEDATKFFTKMRKYIDPKRMTAFEQSAQHALAKQADEATMPEDQDRARGHKYFRRFEQRFAPGMWERFSSPKTK